MSKMQILIHFGLPKKRQVTGKASLIHFRFNIAGKIRGGLFRSRKVFERVHFHVMASKIRFRSTQFFSKFMITCSNPILVHFSGVRISDFGPDSYFESKLEQNRKFELLKSGSKSGLDT